MSAIRESSRATGARESESELGGVGANGGNDRFEDFLPASIFKKTCCDTRESATGHVSSPS